MPIPRVIDLSHHNVIPESLEPARDADIVAVIHKCTEGASYVDDKVQSRYHLARDADMAWGLYHFLRPGDMEEQAAFFVGTARRLGVLDHDTCLVADHEDEDVSGEELKAFLDAVEDATARSPVVYSGHVLKEQLEGSGWRLKRRLWLAQYASEPILPQGVDEYWLWQYTDQGSCPGIEPPVDLNHFDGDAAAFLASWAGSHYAPEPVEITITVTSPVPVKVVVKQVDSG